MLYQGKVSAGKIFKCLWGAAVHSKAMALLLLPLCVEGFVFGPYFVLLSVHSSFAWLALFVLAVVSCLWHFLVLFTFFFSKSTWCRFMVYFAHFAQHRQEL